MIVYAVGYQDYEESGPEYLFRKKEDADRLASAKGMYWFVDEMEIIEDLGESHQEVMIFTQVWNNAQPTGQEEVFTRFESLDGKKPPFVLSESGPSVCRTTGPSGKSETCVRYWIEGSDLDLCRAKWREILDDITAHYDKYERELAEVIARG